MLSRLFCSCLFVSLLVCIDSWLLRESFYYLQEAHLALALTRKKAQLLVKHSSQLLGEVSTVK